jgi:DNA-binding NarL/FixJ family response regulator
MPPKHLPDFSLTTASRSYNMLSNNTMVETPQTIRLIIADQQALFRQGVSTILKQNTSIDIVNQAGSEQELMAILNTVSPDVLLMDINLSPTEKQNLAKTVKQLFPSIAIILLTPKLDDDELFQAIKSRASGYLSRNVSADELVSSILRAARGEHPINDNFVSHPTVADKVLKQFQDFSWGKGAEAYVSPLTPRETEILTHMAHGNLNKQIASMLNISEQTIKNHITSILRKLDANARTQAVVTAIKLGLIKL